MSAAWLFEIAVSAGPIGAYLRGEITLDEYLERIGASGYCKPICERAECGLCERASYETLRVNGLRVVEWRPYDPRKEEA